MNSGLMLGYLCLLAGIFVARIIYERGLKLLSSDQKASLLDDTSNHRIYNFGAIFALVALYFFGVNRSPQSNELFTLIFILLAVFVSIVSSVIYYCKFQKMDLPNAYISHFLFGLSAQYVGFITYVGIMARAF